MLHCGFDKTIIKQITNKQKEVIFWNLFSILNFVRRNVDKHKIVPVNKVVDRNKNKNEIKNRFK